MKLVQLTLIGQAAMPVFVNPEKMASLVTLSDRTSIVRTATIAHGAAIVYDVRELAAEVVRLLTASSVQTHRSSPDHVTVRPR
ncbi:hypothetical protein FHT86_000962 [Rhizobium sp. BK313]|nr:hypothetical protein [Rhizobium sp. BK313]